MGRKNILLALCALKNVVFVEKKIMSRKKNTAAKQKKNWTCSNCLSIRNNESNNKKMSSKLIREHPINFNLRGDCGFFRSRGTADFFFAASLFF